VYDDGLSGVHAPVDSLTDVKVCCDIVVLFIEMACY